MIPRWWRWAAVAAVVLAAGTFALDRTAAATMPQQITTSATIGAWVAVRCPPITDITGRSLPVAPWVSPAPWAASIVDRRIERTSTAPTGLGAGRCDYLD